MSKRIITSIVLILACSAALAAPPPSLRVAALWRSGNGAQQIIFEGTAAQVMAKRGELGKQGYGVSSIAAYLSDGERYVAVFEPMPESASAQLFLGMSPDQFASLGGTLFDAGFRVVDVALSMDPKNGKLVRYSSYWRKGLGNGSQLATMATSWSAFAADGQKHFGAGRRLVSMGTTTVLDDVQQGTRKPLFTGIWSSGQGNGAMWAIPPADGTVFSSKRTTYRQSGLQTVAFSAYTIDGSTPQYSGIVGTNVPAGEEFAGNANTTWDQFIAQHKKLVAQGYRLADVSVFTTFTKN